VAALIDAAGYLVDVVRGVAKQPHHFVHALQIYTHDLTVNGHLQQIGAEIFNSRLRHAPLYQRLFLGGDAKRQRDAAFAGLLFLLLNFFVRLDFSRRPVKCDYSS
jgi:hypothetical protein